MKIVGEFWKPVKGERITEALTQKLVTEWQPISNLVWDEAILLLLSDQFGNVTVGYCDPIQGEWIDCIDEENPMTEPVWYMDLPIGRKGFPTRATL